MRQIIDSFDEIIEGVPPGFLFVRRMQIATAEPYTQVLPVDHAMHVIVGMREVSGTAWRMAHVSARREYADGSGLVEVYIPPGGWEILVVRRDRTAPPFLTDRDPWPHS